jgi:hypothetical protein
MTLEKSFIRYPLFTVLLCGLLTSCSSKTENSCDAIVRITTTLSEKADEYWAIEHEKGTGNYSKSEALIFQFDKLIVENSACFTEQQVSFSEERVASGVNS